MRPVGSAAVTSVDMPVEGGFGRVGGAEMEALGNFFDGECGFVAKPGSDGEFGGIVPAPGGELFGGPAEAIEFFGDDAFGAKG